MILKKNYYRVIKTMDKKILLYLSSLFFLVAICLNHAVAKDGQNLKETDDLLLKRDQILVLGKVSEDPKKHYKNHKPIADYLVKKTADLGILKAEILFARDNAMMISYLRQGKIDLLTETPFSAIEFVKKGGAEILLRRWKKRVAEYHTIFFTRKDSAIFSLQDLKGKTIAFEDSGSTSSFLLPAATLIQNGFKLVELATPREKPPVDMIGYVFGKNEVNSPTWVVKKLVDAAAFSNLDWDDDGRTIPSMKQDLRIFHKTDSVPRSLELVRGDLSIGLKNRLREVLINAHEDPAAKQALKAYKKTTQFDDLTPEIIKSIEYVDSLSKIIKSELM